MDRKDQALWIDEGATYAVIRQPNAASILTFLAERDAHPPLYFLLLKAWTRIAGDSVVALRLFSALASLLSVAAVVPLAREMRYPIVLTEGFGPMPMNSAAYKLLSTNAKREVTVNAENRDRYSGACPEVIIPLPVSADRQPPALRDVETLAPGIQVRMRRPPSAGMIGSITALKPGLTAFPSGLRAPAAEVKLENGETVLAPLINLEVIG